jgi:uncharacterized membrane protein (UPF0127 family)/TolB-like protein
MKKLVMAAFAALVFVSLSAAQNFTGSRGRGTSLAVLVPSASGLSSEQNYLPTMVQGVLVGNFAKYSAITVIDRQTLEKTLRETESGIYRNEADYGRLGEVANVDYALTGNITKTGAGYAMQIQVMGTGKNNIGVTKASYSGSCTIAELDNFTGIRRASMELLTQMGVNLTNSAKSELSSAGQTNYVNAQIALFQGIIVQRSGNTVETMARFYEAVVYDPSFSEAATRANTMSASIRTGSLGENIRNDIAWHDEWGKILNDATKYILTHPPVIAQVVYEPTLIQGKIDYDKKTVDFGFFIDVIGVRYPPAYLKMEADLNAGLAVTGRNKDWNYRPFSLGEVWRQNATLQINFAAQLVNSAGKIIAETDKGIIWSGPNGGPFNDGLGNIIFQNERTLPRINDRSDQKNYPIIASFTAKADDITDQMPIRLRTANYGTRNREGVNFSNYPVQVMTRQEFLSQIEVNGLPQMDTGIVSISSRRSRVSSMIVEVATKVIERYFGLSYRRGLLDGEGLWIPNARDLSFNIYMSMGMDQIFDIDTTHYRFPVSMAYICERNRDGATFVTEITNIEPGRQVPIPERKGDDEVVGVLIVPKGWFERERIRAGDYFILSRNSR